MVMIFFTETGSHNMSVRAYLEGIGIASHMKKGGDTITLTLQHDASTAHTCASTSCVIGLLHYYDIGETSMIPDHLGEKA